MKLYQSPISPNARKVVMAASLLELDVELVLIDLTTGKGQSPDYLKINPMGKVPTLVDGDMILWESHAIMQYMADKTPGNTLYPSDLAARADVNRWLFWTSTHFSPYVAMLVNQNVFKKMMGKGDPEPTIVAYAEGEIARFGKVLDDHLANRNCVAGKGMTLADLAIASPLMYSVPAKLPIDKFSNIKRWFDKIQDLDAWKKTIPSR